MIDTFSFASISEIRLLTKQVSKPGFEPPSVLVFLWTSSMMDFSFHLSNKHNCKFHLGSRVPEKVYGVNNRLMLASSFTSYFPRAGNFGFFLQKPVFPARPSSIPTRGKTMQRRFSNENSISSYLLATTLSPLLNMLAVTGFQGTQFSLRSEPKWKNHVKKSPSALMHFPLLTRE